MHNCKRTKESLIEIALSKAPPDQTDPLWVELERCNSCREEYASLRNALRATDQAMQSAMPTEGFWPGYQTRLRQRLESASVSGAQSRVPAPATGGVLWLRELLRASVRVPLPLASAVVVLFISSILFALYSRRASGTAPAANPPSVITKIVEVPVIREKPVTRVVYLDRNRRTDRAGSRRREQTQRNASTELARRQGDLNPPASLVGFKPASDVKLTIIKGSGRDDK
ncbi:MAG: hypothetical protein ACMG6H_13890 [Acidobacteriota bacterium]